MADDLFLERDAILSDCGIYRYLLRRTWDRDKPRALVVMLNPSTADAEVDDATIRSVTRLLRGLNYGSFEVVNLFALRATDPAELARAECPIGPMNDRIVTAAIDRCDVVICAWGAHSFAVRKSTFSLSFFRSRKSPIYCFGKTKSGAPKHPLYIKSGTALEVYS